MHNELFQTYNGIYFSIYRNTQPNIKYNSILACWSVHKKHYILQIQFSIRIKRYKFNLCQISFFHFYELTSSTRHDIHMCFIKRRNLHIPQDSGGLLHKSAATLVVTADKILGQSAISKLSNISNSENKHIQDIFNVLDMDYFVTRYLHHPPETYYVHF